MRKFVFFLTLSFCGLLFLASPSGVKAQLGDGYASTNQPCANIVCGCMNSGSALGKTCPAGLSAQLVNCTGSDAANGLCEVNGPNPKITKCVNPSCPSASDCGCTHEVCAAGVCSCNNIGSATGKVCVSASLANSPIAMEQVACSGSEFMGGQCDSYVGAATINKCVNPLCPTDSDCVCDGLPVEPTTPPQIEPTATPIPQCFDTCSGAGGTCPNGSECKNISATGTNWRCVNPNANDACPEADGACWCTEACGCSALPSNVFTCPTHPDGQPGKVEGPVFGGGAIPACFKCDTANNPDCAKLGPLTPPQPTVRYDQLSGNQCIGLTPPPGKVGAPGEPACECTGEICCPKCVAPKTISGCPPGCDFDVNGPQGGCACWGTNCNAITVDSEPGYSFDYGSSGGVEDPDVSCVQFPNAGVKEITLTCRNGATCKKEIVIACSCNLGEGPTPAPGGWSYANTSWYKLKDDQFHKLDTINDPIPNPVSPYDGDDVQNSPDPACDVNNPSDIRCFNLNQAGIVTSYGDPINTNGAPISHRQWNKTTYTKNSQYTPESFLDYALARKKTNIIPSPDQLVNLHGGEINILTSDLILRDSTQEEQDILDALQNPALTPYVLIVRGDLTVDVDFNVPSPETNSPLPIAIFVEGGEGATGDLKIHHSVQTMGGVFIADTLDFSYDSDHSPYPLKIKGNVISYAAANPNVRNRIDDPTKPSLFVVFDPIMYLDIMDLLSVSTYDWSEVTQ